MTIDEITADTPLVDLFLWHRQEHLRLATEQTIAIYGLNIRRFGQYLQREPAVGDLTEGNIAGAAKWLREAGFAASTCKKLLVSLNSLSTCRTRRKQLHPAMGRVRSDKAGRSRTPTPYFLAGSWYIRIKGTARVIRRGTPFERQLAEGGIRVLLIPADVREAAEKMIANPKYRPSGERPSRPAFGQRRKAGAVLQEPTTIGELLELYARHRLATAATSTWDKFAIAVACLEQFLEREPAFTDFNEETISEFAAWLLNRTHIHCPRQKIAVDTASMYHRKILALWRFACRRGLVKVWPEQKRIKTPRRIPIAWSKDQLSRIFAACRAETGTIGNIPADLFWTSLLKTLWNTGERITATLATRWDDLELDSGWLVARAENRKGKTEDKTWHLQEETIELLRQMRSHDPDSELVWPVPFCRHTLNNHYKRILRAAGLPATRKHMFHAVRKSVASHVEAAGGNATVLLGHSARSVTEAYLDPKIVSAPQAIDLLPKIA